MKPVSRKTEKRRAEIYAAWRQSEKQLTSWSRLAELDKCLLEYAEAYYFWRKYGSNRDSKRNKLLNMAAERIHGLFEEGRK